MNSDYKNAGTIRTYLLNQASQEYSSWLEEQIFTEEALFQELLIAEDELIDQYLREELTPADWQSFESHFLAAPERQQKLRFSRALRKYVACANTSEVQETEVAQNVSVRELDRPRPTPKKNFFSFLPFTNPIGSYAFVAAMLLVVVGLSWVAYKIWLQQTPQPAGNVYVATLMPGLTRDESSETTRLSIPSGTGTVELRLLLASDEGESYRAELLTSERVSVMVIDDLKSQNQGSEKFVAIHLPAKILKRDYYQVQLSGRHGDGSYQKTNRYQFRVLE